MSALDCAVALSSRGRDLEFKLFGVGFKLFFGPGIQPFFGIGFKPLIGLGYMVVHAQGAGVVNESGAENEKRVSRIWKWRSMV